MKLSPLAIQQINNTQSRIRIAMDLKIGEQWIIKGIKQNKENGFLTKAIALRAIAKETGLSQEEILTEDVDEPAKVMQG